MCNINQAHANSIHIANSVGAPNKAHILVIDEYNHWATRFQGYMMGKDQEIWQSIEKGPHKPTLTQREATDVEATLGGAATVSLTQDDLLKMKAELMAISELNCVIPPMYSISWKTVLLPTRPGSPCINSLQGLR